MEPNHDETGLRRLHQEVGTAAAVLERRHRDRLQCGRGCSSCCVDELTVFEVEADRIRETHAALLRDGEPHPAGACAFLDDRGACRIYAERPYVCRTQGLPLRWIEDDLEYRDICPLNDETGPPLETLAADACWTIGPHEGRLAALEDERSGSAPRRVALRDLFGR